MKDDSLNDTQKPTYKMTVKGNCNTIHGSVEEWAQCKACMEIKRPDSVGISAADEMKRACADPDYYNKEIWNAAIEAAANECENFSEISLADQIRKLKK